MSYESEVDSPKRELSAGSSMCKIPTNQFRVRFDPINDYDTGIGVAIIVDGVICTTKQSALSLIEKRVEELFAQWTTHVSKM